MDLFASKNLKPMLFYEGKLFNSEEYIYEIKLIVYNLLTKMPIGCILLYIKIERN